jgi:predicted  nucleic acid-binding Zn-ribbon protein
MIDTNELRKALLKHQGLSDPSALELMRCMAKVADELDLLTGLLKEEQEDCQKQRAGHNDMIRRVLELERKNERMGKALTEGAPILEAAANRIEHLETAIGSLLNVESYEDRKRIIDAALAESV